MKGQKIVAMGLGRSGLAVARAALVKGASPIVVDEKVNLLKPELVDEARAEGIDVRLGWSGTFGELSPDLVVVNPAVDSRHPKLQERGIEFVSEVEFASRIAKGPIVGITGTNGKSTTTVMTYLALRACGLDPLLCGNLYGSGYPEAPLTEAALNGAPGQPLVAEISSFGLEWTSTFRPRAAAITNIRPDHLDRYDTFEQYAATKLRLFAGQKSDDYAVIRAHDPIVVPPVGPQVLTFGQDGEQARIDETDLIVFGTHIPLSSFPWTEPHNHANAACAALLAYGLLKSTGSLLIVDDALPAEIVAGLREFRGLAHRMEFVGEHQGVKVINNSMCTNPDAVVSSAQALREPAHLLIGGLNKGLDFEPLARFLGEGRHRAYLYGKDARQIDREMGGGFAIFETLADAFAAASKQAKEGEVVMLAPGCASSDQFRDFRHRGDVFRAMAQEWFQS